MFYRKLTVSEKARITVVCLCANFIGSILWMQHSPLITLIAFPSGTIIFGLYLMMLKCPNCGVPVARNQIHLFGINTYIWWPWPGKKCSNCGCDIDFVTPFSDKKITMN
jgi:hypothetical protein